MVTSEQQDKVRGAFLKGSLRVRSVGPEGKPEWKSIQAAHRTEIPTNLPNVRISTKHGSMVLTQEHRVFTSPTEKMEAQILRSEQVVLSGTGDPIPLSKVSKAPHQRFMYDMTVEDWHNFLVQDTQIIVSNSPDRNYRFRPPEGEGQVGCFNQVFGFIWEDAEFAEYLEITLWKWNLHPPATNIGTLDQLCSQKPNWQAAILWGALVNAFMALAANWIADEFDYSIGGISLNIDKSSKYMDLKRNAEEQWDKMVESKVRTEKYIRGLAQPRFGRGVRSAFGPHVGRGILSPRGFLVLAVSSGGYAMIDAAIQLTSLSPLLT